MAPSDPYAEEHHWGTEPIDLEARDLPALKARYLVDAVGSSGRVLEIGCGSGRILNTLAENCPELDLHGCDIRPLTTPARSFEFRTVDPMNPVLPYEDASFDAVVLFDVLEHLREPEATLAEARRVSKPTGRLVSFTPMEGNAFSAYRLYRKILGDDIYVETKEHIQAFDRRALTALVEQNFRITNRNYAYHFFGHLMDATLFALLKMPSVRRRFWQENPYYREDDTPTGADATSAFGSILRVANAVAYTESRLLRRVPTTAAGLLFTAQAR